MGREAFEAFNERSSAEHVDAGLPVTQIFRYIM
jgi:hypothetical protein